MSTFFPVAELLTIALFAATVAAVLTEAAPRPRRIAADAGAEVFGGRPQPALARTEADFPSTSVC